MHQSTTEKCPCKSSDLLQKRIYISVKHLKRFRFFRKMFNGFYPITVFAKSSIVVVWVSSKYVFLQYYKPRLHHPVFLDYLYGIPKNSSTATSQSCKKAWSTVWNAPKNSWSWKSISTINQRDTCRYYPKHWIVSSTWLH